MPEIMNPAQESGNEKRMEQMDIARGIGIILVVLGHNAACAKGTPYYSLIFSFHIPLFFFLSGHFHKRADQIGQEIPQRAKKLLVPYFLTGFLFIIYKACQTPADFYTRDVWQLLGGMVYGAGGSGTPVSFLYWPPVWFLTSLFLTQVSFSLLQPFAEKFKSRLVRLGFFAGFLILGVNNLHHWGNTYLHMGETRIILTATGLPWNLDLLPVTLFYYWLGGESRSLNLLKAGLSRSGGIPVLLLSAGLFCIYQLQHARVGNDAWLLDLNLRSYGHAILTTAGAILGILLILALSTGLEKYAPKGIRKALVLPGLQSLTILVFHYFFQEQAQQVLAKKFPQSPWITFSVSFVAGVVIPLLLYLLILQKIPWLRSVYGNQGTQR